MEWTETSADTLRLELQVRNRQIAAVHNISRLLSSTLDLRERLSHILSVSMETVDASAGTLFLHRPDDRKLVFEYVIGEKASELTGVALDDHYGVVGEVFHTGEGQITNRPMESSAHRPELGETVGFTTQSILTVPLMVQSGSPVGVLQLLNKRSGEFQAYDLEVLEIVASIAAAAIENSRLYNEAQVAAIAHRVGDLSHDIKNKVSPIPMAVLTLQPEIEEMLARLDAIRAAAQPAVSLEIERAISDFRLDYPEYFDIIMDQVHAVQAYTKLIADTLKGGASAPEMVTQELTPVIERQIAALEPVAKQHGISLTAELAEIPPFPFDRFRVESAVYNLVNNALPETPSGGSITVQTAVPSSREADGPTMVTIEVRDTGRGMPADKLQKVLRGDAKSDKAGGTGLGTRIIYKAAQDHKGVFEGESVPGAGTTFRILLPFSAAPQSP
jgi:signal transduction histidine kinase